jgi:hypothetical protein
MINTLTRTATVTHTDAKYVRSKIHSDLRQLRALYGGFTAEFEAWTAEDLYQWIYRGHAAEIELAYVDTVNHQRRFSLRFTVRRDGSVAADDDPGGIPFHKVTGAVFAVRVTGTREWKAKSKAEKQKFYESLSGSWGPAEYALKDGQGYWMSDRTYASGGLGVPRAMFRPY